MGGSRSESGEVLWVVLKLGENYFDKQDARLLPHRLVR